MGGSSKSKMDVTLYFMSVHMAIARSIDELVEIRVGGKSAWTGSLTANTSIEFASIQQRWLFGGDTKEGGLWGWAQLMMGRQDQEVNPELLKYYSAPVPAYRGVATFHYYGELCANSPYPKAWSFRVRRTDTGWDDNVVWYPEKVTIWQAGGLIKSMNPAHILYQLWTGRDFRGIRKGRLDDVAWRAFADVLYSEGFGLCLKWSTQGSIGDFMQQVLDHIGGYQYVHRRTGRIVPVAIRGGYDPEDLPIFTADTGLLGIDEYTTDALPTGINEVIVNYKDPLEEGGTKRQVREKNLGAIHAAGGIVNSTTADYIGIPTSTLARRVARRDLNALSGFVRRFKVRLDRRAAQVAVPGGLLRISDPDRNIVSMVLRIGKIDYGTFKNGVITIEAATDVFGMPSNVFTVDEPSAHVPPDPTPRPITQRKVFEVSYRDLAYTLDAANLQQLQSDSGFIAAVAAKPTALSIRYLMHVRVAGAADFANQGGGLFCGNGQLAADVSETDTQIVLTNVQDVVEIQIGAAAMLVGDAGYEIVRVDAYDPLTSTLTVGRGCADTVPAKHAFGSMLWFYQDYSVNSFTEYSSGVALDVKLQPQTRQGQLDLGDAATDTVLVAGRAARPYPPGNFKIDGASYPVYISGSGQHTFSWAHRDRLLQAEQLIDTTQGDVGPEPETTYSIEVYRQDSGALVGSATDITGTSWTWTDNLGSYEGQLIIKLYSERDGYNSWQAHVVTVRRKPPTTRPLTVDRTDVTADQANITIDQMEY